MESRVLSHSEQIPNMVIGARDALRRQVQIERFAELQRYGRERAEALGIGPEDTEALVDEIRSGRN